MTQGFGRAEKRRQKIEAHKDYLNELNQIIPWEEFCLGKSPPQAIPETPMHCGLSRMGSATSVTKIMSISIRRMGLSLITALSMHLFMTQSCLRVQTMD
jgi:hypothetical protein